MPKKQPTKAKTLDGRSDRKRSNRFLLAYEPQRIEAWRNAAERANVSLATWVRWCCDLTLSPAEVRSARRKQGPSGVVAPDGQQL